MVARAVLAHRLRQASFQTAARRAASTAPLMKQKSVSASSSQTPTPPPAPQPQRPQPSWLTRKVQESPTAMKVFQGIITLLGYNSPKQIAGRRAYVMYDAICVPKADEEREFWQEGCSLPPTFQSWFTITNLHVWLLTVRFRALPDPIGKHYVQALIDHFFLDVEDRIRNVLQPAIPKKGEPEPPSPLSTYVTFPSTFYTLPSAENRPKGKAPERLVTRQMKILREQWAGQGMSFDISLIKGDADMAAAVWRNFLGARGARGIVYPSSPQAKGDKPYFRRSVNLVGGEVEKVSKIDAKGLEAEEARDDGSGVHDFAPNEAGKYVEYPELMADIVRYIRRELVRLEKIPDAQIMEGDVDVLKFGRVRG